MMRLNGFTHRIPLYLLALLGVFFLAQQCAERMRLWRLRGIRPPFSAPVPNSILPGPPRTAATAEFRLNEDNARRMRGFDAPAEERWADIAGNYYHGDWIARFHYAGNPSDAPVVRVQWDPRAPTFRGRLEAQGLKPNFAYQIKLLGDFRRDPEGAERIGYAGRWRLPTPARQTNFTDREYRRFSPRDAVEAYLLFDFFVTDRHGRALRDFALDSSVHVLWNRDRQRRPSHAADAVAFTVEADDPRLYARPKTEPSVEHIWAERVHRRYRRADQVVRLPPGRYQAQLVLTEESFHARDRDGGFWATVFRMPVEFEITP